MIIALLDSGTSDSFVSCDVVGVLGLYRLSQRVTARAANGEALAITHFVQLSARLGPKPVRLSLSVIKTTIPIVLGYPFCKDAAHARTRLHLHLSNNSVMLRAGRGIVK